MEKTIQEKVFETLEQTQTNWSVSKLPLVSAVDGYATESFGIFRKDNHTWLGSVGNQYEPMQNAELLTLLIQATDLLNLPVSNGGILQEGKKVFYQIALQDEFIGRSAMKRNVTALNSHNGTSSVGFGMTNTVVICQNTFYKAFREIEKVKHTGNMLTRVKAIADEIKRVLMGEQKMIDGFKRMADMPMQDEIVERLIKKLFPQTNDKTNLSELSTRTKNNIITFSNDLQTEINLEGKTIWGLFNAVTRYTNHSLKNDDKMNSLMTGQGFRLSNVAYNELMAYVENNSAEYHLINA